MKEQYKYFAFISYNSSDIVWGRKLQKKLESYRMPATLCNEHCWERKPLKPVFFAPTDIQPGGLTAELQDRLTASKNLIVICSPNSAKSEWVGKEIAFFHSLGRTGRIHFFIIDGVPHSGNPNTECFNPIVDTLGLPEILGANVNEKIYRWPWLNCERAYVQLITKLLGIEFDSIWQRHRRLLLQKILLCIVGVIGFITALIGVWIANQPVEVTVTFHETSIHNEKLPPLQDAVVTLCIDKETKTDTIHSIEEKGLFANIPHNAIGKKARILVECIDWNIVDTAIVLSNNISISMSRNPHRYGDVVFRLWNTKKGQGVENTKVRIAGQEVFSDAKGYVKMFIPLTKQSTQYDVKCEKELVENILIVPTTESTYLCVK